MKLLSKDLLREYGFIDNAKKSNSIIEVMTKNEFDVVIKYDGSFSCSNLGIEYPLKDTATLRRLYKEVKNEELR